MSCALAHTSLSLKRGHIGTRKRLAPTSSDTTTDPDLDAATDVAPDSDTNAQTHQYTSILVNRYANALTRSHQHTASNEYAIYSTYLNTSSSASATTYGSTGCCLRLFGQYL